MNALKFNHKAKDPLHRLPFIGGKSKLLYGLSFWNVPATGGTEGGQITGRALAWVWLKHIKENGIDNYPFSLSRMVIEISQTNMYISFLIVQNSTINTVFRTHTSYS